MFWDRKVEVNNKAVLITGQSYLYSLFTIPFITTKGCSSGFGQRLALRLTQKGFKVFATVRDLKNPGSIELLEKCQFNDNMSVIQMDVTNEEMINKCYEIVKTELEVKGYQLWAVVNNAGRLA